MSDRLNQYQRRQADRQMNAMIARCMGWAMLLTPLGFAVYYLLIRNSLNQAMYQTVLDSGGRFTFDQVAEARLVDYILPALGVWFCLTLILSIIGSGRMSRQHNDFQFGEMDAFQPTQVVKVSRPRNLAKITPREFEEEVARLITIRTGCKTQVVGGSGDRGVDIKVYDNNHRLVGVVQCKRYRPGRALPPMFVREMATVKQIHQVNIAYIATTTYFTNRSKREAEQLGVRLIDGHDLRHISKKAASPQGQPSKVAFTRDSRVIARNDPDARYRPPQRPMSDQERIQQQLDERRERLDKDGQYKIGAPTVRQAPRAIRTTPRAENQYIEDSNLPAPPPPRAPF